MNDWVKVDMKKFFLILPIVLGFSAPSFAEENADETTRRWHDGLYIGFGIARTVSVGGGMTADYASQTNAGFAPGTFQRNGFNGDNSTPLQFSIGKSINDNVRVEISYIRYSDISIPVEGSVSHGNTSSNVSMLNIYYNLDRRIGRFFDGKLRPYVGGGIGISRNMVSDWGDSGPPGPLFFINHLDETNRWGLAYAIEAGGTLELAKRLEMDIFTRWANLGRMEAVGDLWIEGAVVPDNQGGLNMLYDLHDWRSSGTLSVLDIGVRLRYAF